MSTEIKKFNNQVESIERFYEGNQAIEDSLTSEQKLDAAYLRIEQLEHQCDILARGGDAYLYAIKLLIKERDIESETVHILIRELLKIAGK